MNYKKTTIILSFILIVISILFFLKNNIYDDELKDNDEKKVEDLQPKDWFLSEDLQDLLERVEEIKSVKYEINSKRGGVEELTLRIWEKDNGIRAEYINQWQTNIYFIDMEEEEYYYYRFGDSAAVILSENEIKEVLEESITRKIVNVFESNYPTIIGREEVDSKNCVVIQYNIEGSNKGRMWIWEEYGLPVIIEEGLLRKEIKEIEKVDIADDYLKLPPGIKKVDYFTY